MIGTIAQQATRQSRRRIIAPFTPLAWQVAPWRDTARTLLLTGSAGGGKSRLAAEKLHGYCLRYPHATALALRKVKVSMGGGLVLMMERRIIGDDPRVRHYPSKSRFEYANGSILAYGGLEDEEQRKRLRSIGQDGAVDIAWMEEAVEFVREDYQEVLARLRGKAAPWRQIILSTNPDAPTHWINTDLIMGRGAAVYYSRAVDNPHNPTDYAATLAILTGIEHERLVEGKWVQASGLVYDVWSDGPPGGNVTEAAEYEPGAGPVLWAVDDGYAGKLDPATGFYAAGSHPRVFHLVQERHDGRLCVFAESYACHLLPEAHIAQVRGMGYPDPDVAVVDKSAAELRGRLHAAGIATIGSPSDVEESIKVLRRFLAPDANGWRRLVVHPRCKHTRADYASYARDKVTGRPVKDFDHSCDCDRYLAWSKRVG